MRTLLLIVFIVAGAATLVWLRTRDSASPAQPTAAGVPIVDKQSPVVSTRRFNPAAPSPDMPSLHPGELAVCDSNFMSGAIVSGHRQRTIGNTSSVTITQIKIKLQLAITIWVPEDVTQKVLEHEEGHRQISESYYRTADKLAEKIAAPYIGRELTVAGDDLDAETNKLLEQIGADITAEYNKQLNPDAAQLRYDAITDHSRSDVLSKEAVAEVLKK